MEHGFTKEQIDTSPHRPHKHNYASQIKSYVSWRAVSGAAQNHFVIHNGIHVTEKYNYRRPLFIAFAGDITVSIGK